MKKYPSKKSELLLIFMIVITGLILGLYLSGKVPPFALIPLLAPLIYCTWTYFGTQYSLEGDTLILRSAYVKKSIDVTTIRSLEKVNRSWINFNSVAASSKGILIKYNRFDDVFITPKEQDIFISDVCAANPNILAE